MVLSSGKVRKAEVMWCESWARQLQLAQLPGPSRAATWRRQGTRLGPGVTSGAWAGLWGGKDFFSQAVWPARARHFCSLSQITSAPLSEELQFCMPQKKEVLWILPDFGWWEGRYQWGCIALVILVQIRTSLF